MSQIIIDEKSTLWRDQRAIALLLAASLTTMANATISPALAGLQALFADHPHSELLIPLLVSAPSLTVVLFAPLAGILTDRLGRRWMLLAGVLLFVISGTAGSFLTDLDMIFGSRLVLGLAVAMIMTSQTALVGDYFTGDKRVALPDFRYQPGILAGFSSSRWPVGLLFSRPNSPLRFMVWPHSFCPSCGLQSTSPEFLETISAPKPMPLFRTRQKRATH